VRLVAAVGAFDVQASGVERLDVLMLARVLHEATNRHDDFRFGDDRIAKRVREGSQSFL